MMILVYINYQQPFKTLAHLFLLYICCSCQFFGIQVSFWNNYKKSITTYFNIVEVFNFDEMIKKKPEGIGMQFLNFKHS